jgi:hypothetical protein
MDERGLRHLHRALGVGAVEIRWHFQRTRLGALLVQGVLLVEPLAA